MQTLFQNRSYKVNSYYLWFFANFVDKITTNMDGFYIKHYFKKSSIHSCIHPSIHPSPWKPKLAFSFGVIVKCISITFSCDLIVNASSCLEVQNLLWVWNLLQEHGIGDQPLEDFFWEWSEFCTSQSPQLIEFVGRD